MGIRIKGEGLTIEIEGDEVCEWVKELAALKGESLEGAVVVAIVERLEREQGGWSVERKMAEIREIARRCAARLEPGPSAVDHGDWLYDEDGLPK